MNVHTFPSGLESLQPGSFSSNFFLLFLTLLTLVKVLDDDSDEHVEHEEADEQQERNEVQQSPLVVVDSRLQVRKLSIFYSRLRNLTKLFVVQSACVSLVNLQTAYGWDHLVDLVTPGWNNLKTTVYCLFRFPPISSWDLEWADLRPSVGSWKRWYESRLQHGAL